MYNSKILFKDTVKHIFDTKRNSNFVSDFHDVNIVNDISTPFHDLHKDKSHYHNENIREKLIVLLSLNL